MLTPKMYAEEVGVPYPTVMSWLQADLIPGVEKQELPNGKHYYIVPSDAPRPETRRGPKKRGADDQLAASPAIEEKPAKPAKKARAKRMTKASKR